MKSVYTLASLVATFSLSQAQFTIGPTGNITCTATPINGSYCASESSLQSNIIIRCTGTVGQAGNCNDNLAGVPPVGVKLNALCWESSTSSGDAACSFDGTVYGNNGTFPVPGSSTTTKTTGPSSSSATALPPSGSPTGGYSNSTTTAPGSGSGSAPTSTASSTTVITVCPTCTTTGSGFSVTGGGSGAGPSTITTIIPVEPTGSSGSSGNPDGGSGSGASASPTLSGNEGASLLGGSRGGWSVGAGLFAGFMAWVMI